MSLEIDRIGRAFQWFAEHECADEPLYKAMCEIVSGQPAWQAMLLTAPIEQQVPNLWLAAVHDLLLSGVDHAMRGYYRTLGGTRDPDAVLAVCLADFVALHEPALRERMATHSTQTNEIGRCAVLWPALQALAARTGRSELALLDLGCSAGLNLGVDCYHYRQDVGDTAVAHTDGLPEVPTLPCRLVGPKRPTERPIRISDRLGIDPAPVDLNDELALRWLRACLWPSNLARRERFDQAVALARRGAWPVRQVADCTAAIEPWLQGLPSQVQPVLFNSWVLAYFGAAALARHVDTVESLVCERGLAWLSAEGPKLNFSGLVPPAPFEAGSLASRGSLWTLCTRDADGKPHYELLARSHPHGAWMEWLAA